MTLLGQQIGQGVALFVELLQLIRQAGGIQPQLVSQGSGETGDDGLCRYAGLPGAGDEDGEPDEHGLLADRIVGEGVEL